jgi:hypothetical protein
MAGNAIQLEAPNDHWIASVGTMGDSAASKKTGPPVLLDFIDTSTASSTRQHHSLYKITLLCSSEAF